MDTTPAEPTLTVEEEVGLLERAIAHDQEKLQKAEQDLEAAAAQYGRVFALASVAYRVEWHQRRLTIDTSLRDTLQAPVPQEALRTLRQACQASLIELRTIPTPTYGAAVKRQFEIEMTDYTVRGIDAILSGVQF
jgi:hypothetical protein